MHVYISEMVSRATCFVFPAIFLLIDSAVQGDQEATEHTLEVERTKNATETLDSLLANYDNRLRPKYGGRPVIVHVGVYIVDIGEISVTNMDYRMTIYLRQTWEDPRLKFNGTDYIVAQGNMLDKIWIPDTFFNHEKKSNFHEITKKNCKLTFYPNGTVFLSIRISLTGVCRMNLRTYPLDNQTCVLDILSYSYSEADAIYTWRQGLISSVERAEDISLPQMDLVGIRAFKNTDIYSTGNYSRLSLVFTFQRRLSLFITETYIPSVMIVSLSWVSFFINYKAAPARVALCITTVLTMITLTAAVRNGLPRVTYTKYSDWFLMTCLVYVFGALVEFAVINFHESLDERKNERLKYTLNDVDMERGREESDKDIERTEGGDLKTRYLQKQLSSLREKVKLFTEHDVNVRMIDSRCRVLFPLTFVIVNVIFWIYFIIDSRSS